MLRTHKDPSGTLGCGVRRRGTERVSFKLPNSLLHLCSRAMPPECTSVHSREDPVPIKGRGLARALRDWWRLDDRNALQFPGVHEIYLSKPSPCAPIGRVSGDRNRKKQPREDELTRKLSTPDGSRDHELITCMSGARDRTTARSLRSFLFLFLTIPSPCSLLDGRKS